MITKDQIVTLANRFLRKVKIRLLDRVEKKYPRVLRNEVGAVKKVLKTPYWNMNYGTNLVHDKLEEEFADYIGSKHAVAVNTGGSAIQISLRALGLKYGDEIIHQVDTCVADSFAIMNAGCIPIFSDISLASFMLSEDSLEEWISEKTKAIIPIHMWGNSENMDMVIRFAKKHRLLILEDAALALGTKYNSQMTGSFGNAGVFSFGCLKPIQSGEGGMIVTNDESLAKEMKTIRSWGEMNKEYGIRDQKTLSWNGRMSEVVAAVAIEQLRAYSKVLSNLQENADIFYGYLKNIEGITPLVTQDKSRNCNFSQFVLKLDEHLAGIKKDKLMYLLGEERIPVWHANFEPINSLSFYKEGIWKEWIIKGDIERLEANYNYYFEDSNKLYLNTGIGIMKSNFLSGKAVKRLINIIDKILSKK
jgi:dTDP-4-amino-4,6-dideoxygalactose transaminase